MFIVFVLVEEEGVDCVEEVDAAGFEAGSDDAGTEFGVVGFEEEAAAAAGPVFLLLNVNFLGGANCARSVCSLSERDLIV